MKSISRPGSACATSCHTTSASASRFAHERNQQKRQQTRSIERAREVCLLFQSLVDYVPVEPGHKQDICKGQPEQSTLDVLVATIHNINGQDLVLARFFILFCVFLLDSRLSGF